MAVQIPRGYQDTYGMGVISQVQQYLSRFAPFVQMRSHRSQNHRWILRSGIEMTNTLPSASASNVLAGLTGFPHRQDQVITDIPYDQVWVGINEGHLATTHEISDEVQLNGQLNMGSDIMQEHGFAYGRWFDDRVIPAINGPKIGNGKVAAPLASTQKIAARNLTASGVTLDEEYLAENVTQKFLSNHAMGQQIIAVPPEIITHLMKIDTYKNRDYTPGANLAMRLGTDYMLPMWMGMTWIVSTRLTKSNSGKNWYCPVFNPMTIAYKENRPMNATIGIRTDLKRSPVQYECVVYGAATRLEDKRVVELNLQLTA